MLTPEVGCAILELHTPFRAMSEEQLSALLAKLQVDAGLREKFQGAADLDAAVAVAMEAGFEVSKADWLRYQAQQTLELSDEALEEATGGYCEWTGKKRYTDAFVGSC
jgi:predicted ribosomally synthesized peptide with nif11-like leader